MFASQLFGACITVARIARAQDAGEVEFEGAFLTTNGGPTLDVSRFSSGNPVLPGTYHVDIRMNGEWQARRPVRFESVGDRTDAHACIARDELIAFGVDPAALPSREGDASCLPIERRLDSATARFDVGEQRLDIEVPQAAMARHRNGTVPPEQWDDGIAAGLLSWRVNARTRRTRAGTTRRSLPRATQASMSGRGAFVTPVPGTVDDTAIVIRTWSARSRRGGHASASATCP